MKAERVIKLNNQVRWISENLTDIKRGVELDFKKIILIQPISDSGAIAIFEKASTGKRALFFFLWLESQSRFIWWPPSDSDLLFLARAQSYREKVEEFNARIVVGRNLD